MMTSKMDALLGIKSPYMPYKPVYTYKPITNTHNSYHGAFNTSFKQVSEYTLVRTIWTNGVPAEAPTHYDLARIGIIEIRKLARIRMIFLQDKLEEKTRKKAILARFSLFEEEYYVLTDKYVNDKIPSNIVKYNLKRKIIKLRESANKEGFELI